MMSIPSIQEKQLSGRDRTEGGKEKEQNRETQRENERQD